MSLPIGVNFNPLASPEFWLSPDIWSTMNISLDKDGKLHILTSLAADYVPGSNVMVVANPEIFSSDKNYPGQKIQQNFYINTISGSIPGTATVSVGSPYIQVSWANPSYNTFYASGSPIWLNGRWQNSSKIPANWPVPDEYVDASGRHTSYPAGLNAGQYLNILPPCHNLPTGVYTLIAEGNGTIKYHTVNKYTNQGVNGQANIISGVNTSNPIVLPPDSYFDWTQFVFFASDSGNPLRNVRLVVDGFQDIYQANKNDPNFFMFNPAIIDKLKPFSLVRFMDSLQTNNSYISEWSSKPTYKGTSLGLYWPDGYFEWIVQLCVDANKDIWWCVPHGASDDYINKLANFLFDRIINRNPNYTGKLFIEYSNEAWNWIFVQTDYTSYMNIQSLISPKIEYMSCDRNVVTVRMPGHGFKDKSLVQIENCLNDLYNGVFQINYIDQDNFSYLVNSNHQFDVIQPRHHHIIMALDINSVNSDIVSSLQWDGYSKITLKTTNPHAFGASDGIQIGNASDPGFNQLWWVYQIIDAYTYVFVLNGEGFKRSTPVPSSSLVVNATPKDNQPIRLWKISYGHGAGGPGIVSSYGSLNYYARRSAQINKVFHDVFQGHQDRLGFALCWQMPDPNHVSINNSFTNILSAYKDELGGSFLPNSETSIAAAPYFYPTDNSLKITYNNAKTINSITSSGNVAVVNVSNHGFTSGSVVGIFNVSPADYCGVNSVNVIDNNTFSFPLNNSGIANGKVSDSSIGKMFTLANPPLFREITSISITGGMLSCASPNHGFADQQGIYLCNAPENMFNSPLNGLFTVNVDSASGFHVNFDSTKQYMLPKVTRMWAYPASAVQDRISVYSPASSVLPGMASMQLTASANPPVTIRCYESGFDDVPGASTFAGVLPAYVDFIQQVALSEGVGDIYKNQYYNLLYNKYGVSCANHYNFINGWSKYGEWGLMQSLDEPVSSRWKALAALSDKFPSPSGSWVTTGTLIPYYVFDSGVIPTNVNMAMVDVNNPNNIISGTTVVNFPNAYFSPATPIVTDNYNITCVSSNEVGNVANSQVNVKITVIM